MVVGVGWMCHGGYVAGSNASGSDESLAESNSAGVSRPRSIWFTNVGAVGVGYGSGRESKAMVDVLP